MNAKIEQKKEYVKPLLMVLEYECEGSLLQGSCCIDGSIGVEWDEEAED